MRRTAHFCLSFACFLVAGMPVMPSAQAQPTLAAPALSRTFPQDAFWGKGSFRGNGVIQVAGRDFALAPELLARSESNLLVTMDQLATMKAGTLVVFTLNAFGLVNRLWLVSDTEARALRDSGQLPGS